MSFDIRWILKWKYMNYAANHSATNGSECRPNAHGSPGHHLSVHYDNSFLRAFSCSVSALPWFHQVAIFYLTFWFCHVSCGDFSFGDIYRGPRFLDFFEVILTSAETFRDWQFRVKWCLSLFDFYHTKCW